MAQFHCSFRRPTAKTKKGADATGHMGSIPSASWRSRRCSRRWTSRRGPRRSLATLARSHGDDSVRAAMKSGERGHGREQGEGEVVHDVSGRVQAPGRGRGKQEVARSSSAARWHAACIPPSSFGAWGGRRQEGRWAWAAAGPRGLSWAAFQVSFLFPFSFCFFSAILFSLANK